METPIVAVQIKEEELVGRVISHVPKLLEKRGWGAMDLVRKAELGIDTAYKLARGETDFTIQTLEKLCKVFGVPVQRVIEFVEDEQPG